MATPTAGRAMAAPLTFESSDSREGMIAMVGNRVWGTPIGTPLSAPRREILEQALRNDSTLSVPPYKIQGVHGVLMVWTETEKDTDRLKKANRRACTLATCVVAGAKFKCGICHIARYCSKAHQTEDWLTHKLTCKKEEGAHSIGKCDK